MHSTNGTLRHRRKSLLGRKLQPKILKRDRMEGLYEGVALIDERRATAPLLAITSLCLAFLWAPVSDAAVWHVAPTPLSSVAGDQQFTSIGAAAAVAVAGDTVIIHSGVYRESVNVARSGTRERPIRFEAAPAANVVVTGLDQLSGWRREAGEAAVFSTGWPHRCSGWSNTDAHPADERHRLIGRAEQVMIDGYPLHQVLRREELSLGSFFVDLEAKRLYVRPATDRDLTDPAAGTPLEAATRSLLWKSSGAHIALRGLRFRYAANPAQLGGVLFEGEGAVAEDCVFERMSSVGASFNGRDQVARRCVFQDNGQLGFSALRAHNLLVTECLVRNNSTENFNRAWEAGGNKIVLSRGVVLEKSQFVENRGCGIAFDIGNEDCTVRNCLMANNEDAGLFYEISYGLRAHDNVAIANGLTNNPLAWGAQAGIVLSSSAGCEVTRNLLIGNREGFSFREQYRTTLRIDTPPGGAETPIWNRDNAVHHNVLAYNTDAQLRGWFDIHDERHWPQSRQEQKRGDVALEIAALERLRLNLGANVYATADAQPLFVWGTSWMRHERYPTLAAVQQALNLEHGSRQAAFPARHVAARDFRIPAGSAAMRMRCYPRGDVPGVRLQPVRTRSAR